MSPIETLLTVMEAAVWLAFIWFALAVLRSTWGLWWSSLVLLALAYLGFVTCPVVRETGAWQEVSNYGVREYALGAIEAVLWYAFIWLDLDTVRNRRSLWWAVPLLLALFYGAFLACPWVRDSEAWLHLWD